MNKFILSAAYYLSKAYSKTFKFSFHNQIFEENIKKNNIPIIYAIFHGQLFPFVYLYRDKRIVTIVSQSKDGEIANFFLKKYGFETVRGSSSRGGVRALMGAKRLVDKGQSVAITVDGPKGPRFEVKPGIIYLAKKTTKCILPVIWSCKKYKEFNSWDRFRLPYPFSNINVVYGEPIYFSANMSENLVEKDRKFLERKMKELFDAHC